MAMLCGTRKQRMRFVSFKTRVYLLIMFAVVSCPLYKRFPVMVHSSFLFFHHARLEFNSSKYCFTLKTVKKTKALK